MWCTRSWYGRYRLFQAYMVTVRNTTRKHQHKCGRIMNANDLQNINFISSDPWIIGCYFGSVQTISPLWDFMYIKCVYTLYTFIYICYIPITDVTEPKIVLCWGSECLCFIQNSVLYWNLGFIHLFRISLWFVLRSKGERRFRTSVMLVMCS